MTIVTSAPAAGDDHEHQHAERHPVHDERGEAAGAHEPERAPHRDPARHAARGDADEHRRQQPECGTHKEFREPAKQHLDRCHETVAFV